MIDSYMSDDIPFPYVPRGKRVIPNDLIRSSLFTVTNHKIKRKFLKDSLLVSFGNSKILYSGEELRQDDEDVWMQLICLCSQNNTSCIEFAPFSIMRMLEWPRRTQYRDKLKECLKRMVSTGLNITNDIVGAGFVFSLVRKFMYQDESGKKLKKWKIWIEPEIIYLFGDVHYSKIIWDQRKKLKPLAKWLHAYYSSHSEPYAVKVETIYAACGSCTKEIKNFRTKLRRALISLVQVGFLDDFWIDAADLVHVKRKSKERML